MARPRRLDFAAESEPTALSTASEAAPTRAAGGASGMDDERFKAYIEDRLTDSMGASDSLIALERTRNLEAYLAEPTGEWEPPEIADRSAVVATDVADTVEWILPGILRVFATNKGAIEATAKRPQYEPTARLVTETLRWCFWEQMKGLTFLYNWAKDGLTQKVGFARVSYRKRVHTSRERYEGLTLDQVQLLAENDDVSIVGKAERTEIMNGKPFQVFDIELEIRESEGSPVIATVPPDELRIDNAASYGEEPKFIAREWTRRRSELEAEGYDCEGISADTGISTELAERRRINTFRRYDDDEEDPLLRVVEAFVRLGGAEDQRWERGLLIGDQLFDREEVEDHDFVWWCPEPMPHVFFGHCPADRAIEPQRLRTKVLRAVDDNLYLSVNGRTGVVDGEVNIDDVLDSRPGGIVRARSKDSLFPIVQPNLSAAAWQVMEWGERWNSRRTGFSELSKGLNSEALNDTATGVIEITERGDMRTELMCRHLAVALETLLSKVMRCMSRHQDVEQQVRIAGQWVAIDPREWANHFSVSVNVGLGAGNKDRQIAQYGQLSMRQDALAQRGLVSPQAQVTLARKLARAMGEDSPEQFFPDPPPPQPPQPPLPVMLEQIKGQQAKELAAVKSQTDLQELQANLQLQASNDARDAERERAKAEMQAMQQAQQQQLQMAIAEMQAANDRYRTELEQQTKLQIASMQMQANQSPQIDLSGLQRLEVAIERLMAAVTAPKRVVRDPMTGRVAGIELATETNTGAGQSASQKPPARH